MPQAFLASPAAPANIQTAIATEPTAEPSRERVSLMVIGSTYATERVIHELYRVGFAEVREWSQPIPTGKVNEVMRILSRYVFQD